MSGIQLSFGQQLLVCFTLIYICNLTEECWHCVYEIFRETCLLNEKKKIFRITVEAVKVEDNHFIILL